MDEIIDIFILGYFDAISDAQMSNILKKFRIDINNDSKAKIYDIGYSNGYKDCFTYLKNRTELKN